MQGKKFWSLAVLLSFLLMNCSGNEHTNEKPLIVTTTGIIADCISTIMGDQAEVIAIMGPGVDPHLYKASQGDLKKLSKADVIIYNGLHLEGKMSRILEKTAGSKLTLSLGEFAAPNELLRVDQSSELRDPHIWFDPALWLSCLEGVAKTLEADERFEGVLANYRIYRDSVMERMNGLKEQLSKELKPQDRILITSHDAFSYFGRFFGFEVKGLQGISTAAEYGVRDVADLVEYIMENKVRSIFIETSISDKNLRSVAESAAARDFEVNIGGTLYSDALGAPESAAGTYVGMIEQNIKTIINGLKEHG